VDWSGPRGGPVAGKGRVWTAVDTVNLATDQMLTIRSDVQEVELPGGSPRYQSDARTVPLWGRRTVRLLRMRRIMP